MFSTGRKNSSLNTEDNILFKKPNQPICVDNGLKCWEIFNDDSNIAESFYEDLNLPEE